MEKKAFCTGTLAVSLLLGRARGRPVFEYGYRHGLSAFRQRLDPVLADGACCHSGVAGRAVCAAQAALRARPGAGVWMSGVNFVFVPLAFCSELYGFLTVLNVLSGTPEQAGRHQTAERILLGSCGCDARGAVRRVRRVVPSGVF